MIDAIQIQPDLTWTPIEKLSVNKKFFLSNAFGSPSQMKRGLTQYLDNSDPRVGFIPTTKEQPNGPVDYSKIHLFENKTLDKRSTHSNLDPPAIYWMPWSEPFTFKFQLSTNSWVPIPTLPNTASCLEHYTVVYGNNSFYILGGINSEFKPLCTAFCISEREGVSPIPNMMQGRHSFPSVIAERDIYVFGGIGHECVLDTAEIFLYKEKTWVRIERMPKPLAETGAAYLQDYCIYVVGGCYESEQYSKQIYFYSIYSRAWSVCDIILCKGLKNPLVFPIPGSSEMLVIGGVSATGPEQAVYYLKPHEPCIVPTHHYLNAGYYYNYCFPPMYDTQNHVLHFFRENYEDLTIDHFYYHLDYIIDEINLIDSPRSTD